MTMGKDDEEAGPSSFKAGESSIQDRFTRNGGHWTHRVEHGDVFTNESVEEVNDVRRERAPSRASSVMQPPSFAESQFATIVRRQRKQRIVSPTMERLEHGEVGATAPPLATLVGVPSTPRRRYNRRGTDDDDNVDVNDENNKVLPNDTPAKREMKTSRRRRTSTRELSIDGWDFAGWGKMSMLELSRSERDEAAEAIARRPRALLGQWRTASLCGNALTGSVFYSLPAVLAASSILTPIGLFLAIALLWPFRPIMCELASAMSYGDAGSYSYFLNTTTKTTFALLAAAFVMLDAVATGAVSAGTAASYISAQAKENGSISASLRAFLDGPAITIILLVGIASIALLGTRGSGTVALVMIVFHLITMTALIVAGIVAWAQHGNATLVSNWSDARQVLTSGKGYARAVFDSFCVSFIGLTGIETSVLYTSAVKKGQFPKGLRSLHIAVLLTEPTLALLVVALLPLSKALSANNVLSLLAQVSSGGTGPWLKYVVVVDAVVVLAGGILTGTQATIGLTQALASDSVLSRQMLRKMPKTGAYWAAICLFLCLSLILCATSKFNLTTLSSIFSMAFLAVMTMFPLSALLVIWNRPNLPRTPRCGLALIFFAAAVGIVAIGGNIALSPIALLQTVLYLLVIVAVLYLFKNRISLAHCLVWLLDERWINTSTPSAARLKSSSSIDVSRSTSHIYRLKHRLIKWVGRQRREPVIFFTKTDEISHLNRALRYVEENEHTSRVIVVHCFDEIVDIPSELEANAQLIDEAYPRITIDLVFVEAQFNPVVVEALSTKLNVAKSRMFVGVIHDCQEHELADFGGLRVISR